VPTARERPSPTRSQSRPPLRRACSSARRPRIATAAALLTAALVILGLGPTAAHADLPPGTFCQLPATTQITARPWAQQRLDPERVWPITDGVGVTVAVIDTGVDGAQPFLSGHVLPGIDVVNGGTADTDCVGHGTLVAGLIAGQPRAGVGFAGIAPGVTVLPVRQTDNSDGTAANLAAAINAAVAAHAQVINISIVTAESSGALSGAVANALARGVIVVAAAGNDQQQGNAPEYPASYPGVISVGSVDADGRPSAFSSSGTPICVVAPGSDIVGPGAGGSGLVAGVQGTSYATPFVAAVAALIRAYRPQLTPAQVMHRIEATAEHPATALPDAQLGWGTVDPYAAVTAVLPEENGASPTPATATKVAPPEPGPSASRVKLAALGLAGGAAVFAVLVALLSAAVHRARAHVRAGTRSRPDDGSTAGRTAADDSAPAAAQTGR
jgi:membrane-anchored mycosin MYCP